MTLVTMAEVAAAVGDAERAAVLHEELLPYEHVNVVVGPALGCFGAVSRYLGCSPPPAATWTWRSGTSLPRWP